MIEHYLWELKYRPKTVSSCILPKNIADSMAGYVHNGDIPNLLLTSPKPGTGKTTIAKALCKELNLQTLFINSSEERGIDTFRNKVSRYVSTMAMTDKPKVVICDEGDSITEDAQKAFRGLIESSGKSARYIITCNYPQRILEPIRSRLTRYDFTIPSSESTLLKKRLIKRLGLILKNERIEIGDKSEAINILTNIVDDCFPDIRSSIIQLQESCKTGKLISVSRYNLDTAMNELYQHMKNGKFSQIRLLIPDLSTNYTRFITQFFDFMYQKLDSKCIPEFICLVGENQRYAVNAVNMEIHISELIMRVMMIAKYK